MKKMTLISLLTLIAIVFASAVGLAAEQVFIQGLVTKDKQLMDQEGNIYKIVETEEGMQVMKMVGEKLEVFGMITEEEGIKEITVESFSVVN